MAKKLVIVRNERSTYEVHGEQERAPQKFVGGLSLDLPRLKTELLQHGCPEEIAAKALREVESGGSASICL
ncbi:MAG: hypothetical protein ACJ746_13705 [Bryobacteraceae bacterium]